ncbi:hypothetical protein OS493_008598 [Desmophyllum pertusum]|uniref:Uncharacterized protein n=1 Tax=Desmophyllum pertusum TaxID=174260 RepID=A0A9W9ZRH0_9CNID|nr:hypothetical protein OS493_008598 [Desmophyllum pertusum]
MKLDAWDQRTGDGRLILATQSDRKAMGRERRRTIYSNNLWVQELLRQVVHDTGKYAPEFFSHQSCCSHRLIPWLNKRFKGCC